MPANTKKPERIPPDADVVTAVLVAAGHRCCICHHYGVQLHHINRDPSDSAEANLAPLCIRDHDLAETPSPSVRHLTPDQIRRYKRDWEAIVRSGKVLVDDPPTDFKASLTIAFTALFKIRERVQRGSDEAVEAESLGQQLLTLRAVLAAEPGGMNLVSSFQRLQPALERFRFNAFSYKRIWSQNPHRQGELATRLEAQLQELLVLIDANMSAAQGLADNQATQANLLEKLVKIQEEEAIRRRDHLFARLDVTGDQLNGDGTGSVTVKHVGGEEPGMRVQVWVWRDGSISLGQASNVSKDTVESVPVELSSQQHLSKGPFADWLARTPPRVGHHLVGVYWQGLMREDHYGRSAWRVNRDGKFEDQFVYEWDAEKR
jgi:hypothetical protein